MVDRGLEKALRRRLASKLTVSRLKELLDYDPLTGIFTWKVKRPGKNGGVRPGDHAGMLTGGYILIGIDGEKHQAHHLAWLFMTGSWSANLLDHEDGNGLNNRWANIREATRSQNNTNCGTRPQSATGFKGVRPHRDKFVAQISINNKTRYLGIFETPEEAHTAYTKAANDAHGEFARAL